MGGDDDSSDDDDDDLLQGLARPQLNAAVSTGDAKEDELDSDDDNDGDASAGPGGGATGGGYCCWRGRTREQGWGAARGRG